MRVALAGLGSAAARGHLPALARLADERRVELVAAADPDAERRLSAAAALPGVPLFVATDEMLAAVASDVLVVATEPRLHARLVAAGLLSGRHVVCEKPVSVAPGEYDLLRRAALERRDLALVAVHQYRYSPGWSAILRWARGADRVGIPFDLRVDVERVGTDSHACSPWRASLAASGGMLADHGVHFVALGWTISQDLEVLAGSRCWEHGRRERAAARVRVGSGVLDLRMTSAGRRRRTSVELRVGAVRRRWSDENITTSVGVRVVRRHRAAALSDRRHVDDLYLPLYRELAGRIDDCAWRTRATDEALAIGATLVELLSRCGAAT